MSTAQNIAAIIASIMLVVIAALHVYWALGGFWPGEDEASLVDRVVGTAPGTRFPPPWASLLVSLALLAAAWLLAAARGYLRPDLPPAVYQVGMIGLVAVLALRGVGGLFHGKLRPESVDTAFHGLNLRLYSPLCILLAALGAVAGPW